MAAAETSGKSDSLGGNLMPSLSGRRPTVDVELWHPYILSPCGLQDFSLPDLSSAYTLIIVYPNTMDN